MHKCVATEKEHNLTTMQKTPINPRLISEGGTILSFEINVDLIFCQTSEGKKVMENLKEGKNCDDKMIKSITHLLCDFLKMAYGVRASTFHKNMLAKSLVTTYPKLASRVSNTPQALWFLINGRGEGRHAGKIHYHMEYLAKKQTSRVFVRKNTKNPVDVKQTIAPEQSSIDFFALVEEFKFIVPSKETKSRIEYLWETTFQYRNEYRKKNDFLSFLEEFPAAVAFRGQMISYDFQRMYNNTLRVERW
ncbi:uncharacterized protein LOC131680409 [Topomyia yanbarensis]|uniref:uncharacterized protein LOC131680409 n=1 Tax=Topomyia yanbarensis TaxID=2498891 RepID=UPI00273B79F5|nr:uncharacterized protein LOC131680409 [Topomyia yanbarensis]